jgi:hypothetical protein
MMQAAACAAADTTACGTQLLVRDQSPCSRAWTTPLSGHWRAPPPRAGCDAARRRGLDSTGSWFASETAAIRSACGLDFSIVTQGVRDASAGTARNDQSRTMGPAEAIAAGASYIVVGRPIIAATDPRSAAAAIVEELGRLKAAPTTTSR